MASLFSTLLRTLVRGTALLAFAACAAVVVKLTLTPSPASAGIAHTNLHPGATIGLYLDQPSVREALLQIGGNIAVGMPFGLLLPVVSRSLRGPVRVTLLTAAFITVIEGLQHYFVEGRSFDVDDIILAAAGALVAYLVAGRPLSGRIHSLRRPGRTAVNTRVSAEIPRRRAQSALPARRR
ncbi:VanZ family protein [Streptacidiphilus neutrinimicus]|uniref:VanZ family protein n=1 Tax=Streptacidiphilus neutrinimicus TaxID=105420 RepID=UPI00069385D4|nr:VanZ family protein [Streptacidiphilus neutrinimicus]